MSFWLTTKRTDSPNRVRTDSPYSWFERAVDSMLHDWPQPLEARTPALNFAENEKNYTLSLELPGVDEKDISIELVGNELTVRGERKRENEEKNGDFHRVEHSYGSFVRTLTLPDGIAGDKIDAQYDKGILTVTVPKVELTPARKIKVKAR